MGRCLHLRTCPIKYVSFDGIAATGITCVASAGAMLPAPGLLMACSLEDSHDVSLFTQGMAMTNVDVSLSPGSMHCNGTTAHCVVCMMWHRGHWLPFDLGKVFQSLSALGLHVACLLAVETLSPRPCLCLCLCLCPCPCSSDSLRAALAMVDCDVYCLCSRDLENVLSHLCDPHAVLGEVLFDSNVLSPSPASSRIS